MNRFAVVLTCTQGLIENVTAAFNGIELYGNDVDVHLLSKDMDEKYLNALPNNYTVVRWPEIVDEKRSQYKQKNAGWEVRFYRYKYVRSIRNNYDGVMILDADVFVVGNFMHNFEVAVNGGVLVMPDNPWGMSIEAASLDNIHGASSPPFHCHPHFFDPKKYDWLMEQVYEWGKKEDYGDMATLYRTLLRNNAIDKIKPIPNDLYCFTSWHKNKINLGFDSNGLMELTYNGERMFVVHRRWAMKKVRDKFGNDLKGKDVEIGKHNLDVFANAINWLNDKGSIKWRPYTSEKTICEWNS